MVCPFSIRDTCKVAIVIIRRAGVRPGIFNIEHDENLRPLAGIEI